MCGTLFLPSAPNLRMSKSIWPDGDATAELLVNVREGATHAVDALIDRHRIPCAE